MNFSAYTKDANENYTQKITSTVFPFSASALLDERLNEAVIHTINDSVQSYKPTTEVMIEATDGTNTKNYYYIVSNDIAQELPNGSGKYKHEIYLIERTKLLEGIYCQSLTFTNSKGKTFTNTEKYASMDIVNGIETINSQVYEQISKFFKFALPTTYEAPSIKKLASIIGDSQLGLYNEYSIESGNLAITTGTEIIVQTTDISSLNDLQISSPSATNQITYSFSIKFEVAGTTGASVTRNYEIKYIASVVDNQYPLKPWTITECVNRCLDLCEPLFNGETPRFRLQGVSYDENGNIVKPYATGSLAEKYDKILSPEFTMTQCTLREQLKVIGGFIHAEPRLTENNEIVFDEYGIGAEASIANKPYIYKAFKHDINEYCTHIETSASNLVNSLNYGKGTVTEPNINNVRTLRTDNVNVMLSDSNAFANTDNKIYDIPNQEGGVLVTLFDANERIYTNNNGFTFENIDITPYIFESHEYANLSSYDSTYPYSKSFALYYTRGEKGIRGLFFKNENAVDQYFSDYAIVNIINAVTGQDVKNYVTEQFPRIAFKITYTPIYDTKFSHNKQSITLGETPFMRVYNQSENLIESKYYGEHIKGVAQRLGNLEQTRTYLLYNLNDIPEIAQTIDGYFIADVKIEILSAHIKCTVELTKDFNRISQYVGISSNKRVFEVSEANAYARDILLKNYVVISDKAETVSSTNAIFQSLTPIAQIFNPGYDEGGASVNPINAVKSMSYSKTGTEPFGEVILPVIASAFGNTMVFSWDYKDNYSAGEQVNDYEGKDSNNNTVNQVWQTDVPYGDYYGRAYWQRFSLLVTPANGGYEQANTVSNDFSPVSSFGTQARYKLRKDSRERLAVNCELEFVTTQDDIIIGSALASSCPLVSGKTYTRAPQVILYGERINKFSTTLPQMIGGKNISVNYDNGIVTVSFELPVSAAQSNFKSWAIVLPKTTEWITYEDEDGNVSEVEITNGGELLIGRNKSVTDYAGQTTETITFQIARTIYN